MNERKLVTIKFGGDISDLRAQVKSAEAILKKYGTTAHKVSTVSLAGSKGKQTASLQFYAKAEANVRRQVRETNKALREQQAQLKSSTVVTTKAAKSQRSLAIQTRKAGLAAKTAGTNHELSAGHVLKYVSAYAGGAALIGGFVRALGSIPKIGIELQATEAVFLSTFNTIEESGHQLKYLDDLADKAGLSVRALRENYRNFSAATTQLGVSTEVTQRIFTNMNLAARTLSFDADKVTGTFTALTQMFNKGKITAEELQNQLGERLPAAVGTMAEALGFTTKELAYLMEKGLIKPEMALDRFSQVIAEKFGGEGFVKAANGMQAKLARTANEWTYFAEKVFVATEALQGKFLELTAGALKFLRVNFDELALSGQVLTAVILAKLIITTALWTTKTWGQVKANSALIVSNKILAANAAKGLFGPRILTRTQALGFKMSSLTGLFRKLGKVIKYLPLPTSLFRAITLGAVSAGASILFSSSTISEFGDRNTTVLDIAQATWNWFTKHVEINTTSIRKYITELWITSSKWLSETYQKMKDSSAFTTMKKHYDELGFNVANFFRAGINYAKTMGYVTQAVFSAIGTYAEGVFAPLTRKFHEFMNTIGKAKAKLTGELFIPTLLAPKTEAKTWAESWTAASREAQKSIAALQGSDPLKALVDAAEGYSNKISDIGAGIKMTYAEIRAEIFADAEEITLQKQFDALDEAERKLNAAKGLRRIEAVKAAEDFKKVQSELQEALDKYEKNKAGKSGKKKKVAKTAAEKESGRLAKAYVKERKENALKLKELTLTPAAYRLAATAAKGYGDVETKLLQTEEALIFQLAKKRKLTDAMQLQQIKFNATRGSQNGALTEEGQVIANNKVAVSILRKTMALEGYSQAIIDLAVVQLETEQSNDRALKAEETLAETTRTSREDMALAIKEANAEALDAYNQATMMPAAYEAWTLSLKKLGSRTEASVLQQKKATKAITEQNEMFGRLADSVENGSGNMKDRFQSFADAYIAEIERMYVYKPMLDSLFGAEMQGGGRSGGLISAGMDALGDWMGFATGGSFVVGGSGGTDSQPVRFKATPGERVTIETPAQQSRNNNTASSVTMKPVFNINVLGGQAEVQSTRSNDTGGMDIDIKVLSDAVTERQLGDAKNGAGLAMFFQRKV